MEGTEILRGPILVSHRPKGLIHRVCDAFSITEIGAVDGYRFRTPIISRTFAAVISPPPVRSAGVSVSFE